jgi:signal transduction histidine kinase
VIAAAITPGTPPVWEKWWFRVLVLVVVISAILAFYRWRMRELTRQLNLRFEERLAERTRIAQEIHDTLLQGFLSVSMQLHTLTDQLPPGSPQAESLAHILKLMGKVIDEGRNAVRGLCLSFDNSYDLEKVFSRLPEELAPSHQTDFRIIVEGSSRTLHPIIRDEVYRIGREALSNAFRHSGADRVQVELEYGDRALRVLIRDNGRGIDPQMLQSLREGHSGLSAMRDRAQKIGAKLKVWSSAGTGTEVGLSVPGGIAFRSQTPSNFPRWLSRLFSSKKRFRLESERHKSTG